MIPGVGPSACRGFPRRLSSGTSLIPKLEGPMQKGRSSRVRLLAPVCLLAAFAPALAGAQARTAAATPQQAAAFMDSTERELTELNLRDNQAGWVAATYITHDTEELAAEASKNLAVAVQRRALAA